MLCALTATLLILLHTNDLCGGKRITGHHHDGVKKQQTFKG